MKKNLIIALLGFAIQSKAQVQTTYLWHMHQPTYWGDKSKSNPNRSQLLKESQDLKLSGQNTYSDGIAHPTNNLEEIFSLADRVNAYQFKGKNAVNSIRQFPKAGAQITYGGSLLESINSIATTGQWGYQPNWASNIITAKSWLTSGGKTRMDLVNFTMHHSLSPLLSDEVLKKEIQAFKFYAAQTFGSQTSKGYWPAECAFSERNIKVLVEEGIEWSVVANSHLARTLADYPLVFGTNGCNIDPPNKADKSTINGTNWHNGQIDGRGGQFAAPYCFTPHKAKYVDPNTGTEYKLDIVPMADLDSYRDGYSQQGIGNLQTNIAPYSPISRPSLMLLAHDGDNAWGGGSSYYDEAVPGFTGQAAAAGYVPTTIQQYLSDFPVPATDLIHVEDGSWVNAANDWGSPQFINWVWPMFTPTYEFNANGWTEDIRNQAVMIAAENHCIMAEQLEGNVQIADIVNPTATASPAEKAWHFYMPGLDSGNAYYGDALDLEIKATVAANNAISFAQPTLNANPGVDTTKPSVFVPQRYPYNPGEVGFGPTYAYQQKLNTADFTVWTLAYDVSGIQTATLKYRIDGNGTNPLTSNQNETYAGGSEVGNWINLPMNSRIFPKDNVTNNPNISFFILPTKIATQYYAKINGVSEKLVDYYIEITDSKGNINKTAIQHTWVGKNLNISPVLTFNSSAEFSPSPINVTLNATDSNDPSPKIYYTTDGTIPTLASASAISSITINVAQTKTIKAFAVDVDGNQSGITSKTYTIGAVPSFTVHFKAPTTWTSPRIHYWDALPAGSLTASTWPGIAMTPECDGWYRFTFTGVASTKLIFNNGSGGNGNQTADLTASANGWYNFTTSSWITEPTNFNTPCLSVTPVGGTFNANTTVNVNLSAKDNASPAPTIYYTLDGSTPTTSSTSAVGNVTIPITTTKTLKAFTSDNTGVSSIIRTENYNFTTVTPVKTFTVYFKSPTSWTTRKIYFWNATPTGSLANAIWPGLNMTAHTGGWYKYTFTGVDAVNIIFNNGNSGLGTNQTANILNITGTIWYDWTSGIIAPPVFSRESLIEEKEFIQLYPNPTSGLVTIDSSMSFGEVSIYANTGVLVKKFKINSKTIDISDLPSGIYIFKLITKDQKIAYKQLIKN
ncbi:starch-binding protein [Flavobacterium sp.]|uniref:starch-binding protein n=1 Tax=Flavobacterium sp. TaxID=239 RepID=UPI00286E8E3F|nr:starch-binding protein [Flavobacterium sp.]